MGVADPEDDNEGKERGGREDTLGRKVQGYLVAFGSSEPEPQSSETVRFDLPTST